MKVPRHFRPAAVVLTAAVVAIAAFSASATGAGGPAPATPPTIAGTAKSGETLTVTPGTWATPPTSVAYQWQRCSDAGTACANITGATTTTYVPTSADVGNTDRVVATATDAGGTSDSPSAVTAVVVSGAAPVNSVPPTVTGTPTEGQALVAADGTWAGAAPIAFTYAWSRCDATGGACVAITGAVAKTYTLVVADIDKTIRVTVTAKNTPGTASQTSIPTAAIERLTPASIVTLPSGAKSIDVADVSLPQLLVITKASFSPNPLNSRAAFTAKVHVSDTRGYAVRNAIVYVEPLPFGRANQPGEVKTGSDGVAMLTLRPTSKLPLQKGATLVMFIRARKAGDKLISGVSARRLVNLRVVPSA